MHSWQGYGSAYNKSNSKAQRRLHLASSFFLSSIHQHECTAIRPRSCEIIFLQFAEVRVQGMNLPPLFRFLVKRRRKVLVGAKVHRKRGKLDMKERGVDSFRGSRVTPTDRVNERNRNDDRCTQSRRSNPIDPNARGSRSGSFRIARHCSNDPSAPWLDAGRGRLGQRPAIDAHVARRLHRDP